MKLKLELVPAAGDKLVLKLSPPPPLADKQVCVNLQCTGQTISFRFTAGEAMQTEDDDEDADRSEDYSDDGRASDL